MCKFNSVVGKTDVLFFKQRCSTIYEMLKAAEAVGHIKNSTFFEDSYYVLEMISMNEYKDVYYFNTPSELVKDCMFHDLPKHYKEDKYFEDFVKMKMPDYTDSQILTKYKRYITMPNPTAEDLFNGRIRALKKVFKYLVNAFEFIEDVNRPY